MSWKVSGSRVVHESSGFCVEFNGGVANITSLPSNVETRQIPRLLADAEIAFKESGGFVATEEGGAEVRARPSAGKSKSSPVVITKKRRRVVR